MAGVAGMEAEKAGDRTADRAALAEAQSGWSVWGSYDAPRRSSCSRRQAPARRVSPRPSPGRLGWPFVGGVPSTPRRDRTVAMITALPRGGVNLMELEASVVFIDEVKRSPGSRFGIQ